VRRHSEQKALLFF